MGYFAGSFPTNFIASCSQPFNWTPFWTPSRLTTTQPFIVPRPLISNSLTWASFSASSLCSGPSRTSSESFLTPTRRLPFSRKPRPLNIFFSSTPFLRARASRMRAARDSSKAIGSLQGSLVVNQRLFYLDGQEVPHADAEAPRRPLVCLHGKVRRRLALHRHRQGHGPALAAAQRRDRLSLHS